MIDPNRLCLGCMNELEEENKICKICGWNSEADENSPHQLKCGTVLQGKYLVGKVLGEGGFGITYLGFNLLLQEKVAIKEFYPHGFVGRDTTVNSTVMSYVGQESFTEKSKDGFIREAKTMQSLNKVEGIVEMKDVFAENNTVYIVMEYVEGKTLKEYVKGNGNKLPMSTVLKLLEPVMNALEQIHAHNLIHRDISPDNIMVGPDGKVTLLDLGAARQISADGGHSLTVNVKHGYAPMEQYQTHGEQGPWTDIYALCATIYRLITGKVPPSAADRAFDDKMERPMMLGADITEEQERILLKGLAPRSGNRYLNMFELRDAFNLTEKEDVVEGKVVSDAFEEKTSEKTDAGIGTDRIFSDNLREKTFNETSAEPTKEKEEKIDCVIDIEKILKEEKSKRIVSIKNTTKEIGIFIGILAVVAVIVISIVFSVGIINRENSKNKDTGKTENISEAGDDSEKEDFFEEEITDSIQAETISAGFDYTIGLKADGTVVSVGLNDYGQSDVSDWSNIVSVSAGDGHAVGLKSDGTVVAVGDNISGQCNVSEWKDIIAVSAGCNHTVGLKIDGTVVAVGDNVIGECNVSNWTNIVAVSSGGAHTVGLRSDGTVVAVGYNDDGQCNISHWTDIVDIYAGAHHTIGLKSDGTVVAVGLNEYGQCNVSEWKDIVAVSASYDHTVGVKSDGTVVAVGANVIGKCNVSGWTNIVAVSAGVNHTVGLESDGTVVAVGSNEYGQYDVSDWTDIKIPKGAEFISNNTSITPSSIEVGDYIIFGCYEQDNNFENGAEPIEWQVLDVQDGKAFIVSRFVLDSKEYQIGEWWTEATWETCSLRKWLNDDFLKSSFSLDEQNIILSCELENTDSYSGADGGNNTEDKIFLLSVEEAEKYFSSEYERDCWPTDYAKANNVFVGYGGNAWWCGTK